MGDAEPVAVDSAPPEAPPQSVAVPEQPADAPGADPSINTSWSSEDIDPLVARLERESREVYAHRKRVLQVVDPKPGQVVADIGAGSGFMTRLFAGRVGPDGRVVAVDINPVMLERLAKTAKKQGLNNVETRVSAQAEAPLQPDSVDLVFICDTYHHFESPSSTMRSIRAALRDDGQLVVVDFERIPGKTSKGMMEHVRAGKEVFLQEILDAGFELVTEHDVAELEENYVLRFRKSD